MVVVKWEDANQIENLHARPSLLWPDCFRVQSQIIGEDFKKVQRSTFGSVRQEERMNEVYNSQLENSSRA